jgi:hypothetical protein
MQPQVLTFFWTAARQSSPNVFGKLRSMPQPQTDWPDFGASISPWASISRGLGCQTVSGDCHRSSIRPLTRTGRPEQSGPCKSRLLRRFWSAVPDIRTLPSRKLARHSSQGVRQGSAADENTCGRSARLGDRCGRRSVNFSALATTQIAQQ